MNSPKLTLACCILALSACSQPNTSATLPANKDTLVIINGAEPSSLDPQLSQDTHGSAIIRQMFEGLVTTDATGKTVPALATSWHSDDHKTWTFTLRDANWSNGEPIRADDVVFALRRLVDPATASPYASYLADVKVVNAHEITEAKLPRDQLGVRALNDKTVEIRLLEAVPYFVDMLALPVTYPVPQKVVEQFGEKWLNPEHIVVSGAYRLSEWTIGSHIKLERNLAYYDNAKTQIDKVQFLPITAQNGLNRYLAGEADIAPVPGEQLEKIKADLPSEIHTAPKLCTFYLEPNIAAVPLNDTRIRQALSMTVMRDPLVKALKRGEVPTYQLTPSATQGMGEISPEWTKLDQDKRNQQAQALLAQAGYSTANPLRFEFLYATSETGKMLSSAVAAMWKQNLNGAVDVTQNNQEWKAFLDSKNQGKYTITLSGWCADYNEPSSFLNLLKTGNSNNTGKYSNAQYDALLASTLSDHANAAARTQAYTQAEILISQDTAVIPLFSALSVRLVKPYVSGFSNDDPLDNYLIKDLSFKP